MDKNHSNRTLLGANGVVKERSESFASNEGAGLFCFTGDMKRYKKKDYLTTIELLEEINHKLQERDWKQPDLAAVLADCQEAAIALGTNLEQRGEIGFQLTHILEEYCENLYQLGERLDGGNQEECVQIAEKIDSQLAVLKENLEEQWEDKREIVFLPYKASMWDSLESIWMAAEADPACDAYVIPIPYYERNADGSLGTFHYEGAEFPEHVPITYYEEYSLAERRPDVIYIHNPYDQANSVTSIDPAFYSAEIKKYTDVLVYVPYYATTGGMAEGQKLCLAYLSADYIVIQSEKYRKFFDERLSDEKFLPFGSPKFDKVIRLCNNPPEPPENWKSRMKGKKVYFYNTSLSGMLWDTRGFLLKMEYVFRCFDGRDDCCLLWRPHPLLETTFDSMRKAYRPFFDQLKQKFMEKDLGIYDDTPDIEKTIALSDAYVGDSGTSVTSLFGIVGKPLFILNNAINTTPQENDWKGEIIKGYYLGEQQDWMITQGNKVYHASQQNHIYHYYCDLSKYADGMYYSKVIQIDGKVYACPINAQNILQLDHQQVVKKIELNCELERDGAFACAWNVGKYLYLIPNQYPAIVRYDTTTELVDYIRGFQEIISVQKDGEWRIGGSCVWKNYVMIASPNRNEVLAIDGATMQVKRLELHVQTAGGCMVMLPDEEEIWMLPYEGTAIRRWNPATGVIKEYDEIPDGFQCHNYPIGFQCELKPFSGAVFTKDRAILSPCWGNMFLEINKENGEIREWNPPFSHEEEEKNGYWCALYRGAFLRQKEKFEKGHFYYFDNIARKFYEGNVDKGICREIPLVFEERELRNHEAGFSELSDWLKYGCRENSLCSLDDFLDGDYAGAAYDKDREIAAYAEITANADGSCGEKVYQEVCRILDERGENK